MRPSAPSSMLTSALPLAPLMSSRCALVALHLFAEEGRDGEDGGHAPGLRDGWKMDCLMGPIWESPRPPVSTNCQTDFGRGTR